MCLIKINPAKDYADSAFRYWAERGCISYEAAVAEVAAKYADPDERDRAIEAQSPCLLDILACEETFRRFTESGREVICDAVRAVYMVRPEKVPKATEVTARILAFSRKAYVSERQVKRYLAAAREEFARVRGLRRE